MLNRAKTHSTMIVPEKPKKASEQYWLASMQPFCFELCFFAGGAVVVNDGRKIADHQQFRHIVAGQMNDVFF